MSAEALTDKYIATMEKNLKNMRRTQGSIIISETCVNDLVGYVEAYLADAKYFRSQKHFETSLTSIAYSEGFLDALILVGAIKVASAQ
jgi:hypothetical protein